MPIYEYACSDCKATHEALQKISDEPLTLCPKCGSETLKKKVAAAGFRLKGGGWYETDFKQSGQKNLAGESSSSASTGSSSSSD